MSMFGSVVLIFGGLIGVVVFFLMLIVSIFKGSNKSRKMLGIIVSGVAFFVGIAMIPHASDVAKSEEPKKVEQKEYKKPVKADSYYEDEKPVKDKEDKKKEEVKSNKEDVKKDSIATTEEDGKRNSNANNYPQWKMFLEARAITLESILLNYESIVQSQTLYVEDPSKTSSETLLKELQGNSKKLDETIKEIKTNKTPVPKGYEDVHKEFLSTLEDFDYYSKNAPEAIKAVVEKKDYSLWDLCKGHLAEAKTKMDKVMEESSK